jgi:hypothetical protein
MKKLGQNKSIGTVSGQKNYMLVPIKEYEASAAEHVRVVKLFNAQTAVIELLRISDNDAVRLAEKVMEERRIMNTNHAAITEVLNSKLKTAEEALELKVKEAEHYGERAQVRCEAKAAEQFRNFADDLRTALASIKEWK